MGTLNAKDEEVGGDGGGGPADPPSTFADLYAEAYEPMVRLGHLLTGSNEAGEELAQDAFTRAYSRFPSLDNPGAYVRTAVVNGCRSWHRRRYLERRTAPRLRPVTTAGAPVGSELFDALDALPFRQRAALVLRFYEDRSIDDIARALGCRPGTAKSLVSRGLAALREVIDR